MLMTQPFSSLFDVALSISPRASCPRCLLTSASAQIAPTAITPAALGRAEDLQLLSALTEQRNFPIRQMVAAEVLRRGCEAAQDGRLWNPMLDALGTLPFSHLSSELKPAIAAFEFDIGPWLALHADASWEETLLLFRFTTRRVTTAVLDRLPRIEAAEVCDILRVAPQNAYPLALYAEEGRLSTSTVEALKSSILTDLFRRDAGPIGCGEPWCPERRPSTTAFDALRSLWTADLLSPAEKSAIAHRAAASLADAREEDPLGFEWRRRVARWLALYPTSRISPDDLILIFGTVATEESSSQWGHVFWSHLACTDDVRDALLTIPSPWQSDFLRSAAAERSRLTG